MIILVIYLLGILLTICVAIKLDGMIDMEDFLVCIFWIYTIPRYFLGKAKKHLTNKKNK